MAGIAQGGVVVPHGVWRMPRKRSPPARISAASTGSTWLPQRQVGVPDNAAQTLVLP